MKREYVIFWSDWDLYRQSFSDVIALDNVQYVDRPLLYLDNCNRRLYDFVHCEHHSLKKKLVHKIVRTIIPKDYWLSFYFDKKKVHQKNCVLIFSGARFFFHKDVFLYIKKHHPQIKTVLFLCDLFNSIKWNERNITIDFIRQEFDLILSFDQKDCQTYGFTYRPLVFSPYRGEIKDLPTFDLYFLGQPKNRFKELISCLEKFWENGLTTDVCLIGVKSEDQVYKDRIQYSVSFIPYEENLQRTIHAKCELEIMQRGGTGYTQRMCEVIALDKRIVTNNPLIHEAPFYNPDYIFQIQSAEDITKDMCEIIKSGSPVDYHYKEKISPVELLHFLESRL